MDKDLEKKLRIMINNFSLIAELFENVDKRVTILEKRPTVEEMSRQFKRRGFEIIPGKEVNQ